MDDASFFGQYWPELELEQQMLIPQQPRELVTSSWDLCMANSTSPTILSFAPDVLEPKQEAVAAFPQPQVNQRRDDAMVAAEPARTTTARPSSQHHQEHVLAERKRREKLAERFVALSKMVPGLRKMDKISVMGDAIRYVRTLEEQVKGMEEQVARRHRMLVVEAAVLVKKPRVLTVDEILVELPEIEARMSPDGTVIVRILCKKRKGALVATVSEVESIGLTVSNTSVLHFTASYLDITIMTTADG